MATTSQAGRHSPKSHRSVVPHWVGGRKAVPLSLQAMTVPGPSHSLLFGVHTIGWQATSPSSSAQPVSGGQGSGSREKQLQTLRVSGSLQAEASQTQGLQAPSPKQPSLGSQGSSTQALPTQT